MSMSLDKKQQSTTTAPTSNTTTATSGTEIHCNATDQHQQQIAPSSSSLNHNNTSSPHKQHNSMPDTPQACQVAATTPPHSSLKEQPPPYPAMAMHNFGLNPLQHEQQQLKHQQQTSGDTAPWQNNNNTISNTNNSNSSNVQQGGTGSNSERANDPQQSLAVNNDHKTSEASPPNQAPNRTLGRHQQHQIPQVQSQQQHFHGVFVPNIPLALQYSMESRIEQLIRTSLSDPPVTPPTSKNNQHGNSNTPMTSSANSNNMPAASSSMMFNSTTGSITSNTSTPRSLSGNPPNSSLGLISTPSSVGPNTSIYGPTLSNMSEHNNGTNNSNNNNNLFAKTSPSQMAAAAALQQMNQSHIQRLQQQQLAHTQPSPYINFIDSGANSSSSSAKSSSNGAPVPQAAHGGSNHQMPKPLHGSDSHSQLSFPNEQHPDGSVNFASRLQLSNASMSNNLNNKMPLTTSQNLPSWQDQVNHANGPIPRLPPLHGPGNQLPPFTTSSSQAPYGFMNAQLPSGLGMVNNNSMIGQDSDSQAKLNAMRNSPGQSNPMQFREEKNVPMTFPTLQSNKQQNNPEFLRGIQANAVQEALKHRMTDERVSAFAHKLFNPSNKRRVELDKDMRMAIQDSLFYTKYLHLANGILSNQVYIPNFDIIEYLRRSSYPPQEVEHIQRVNKLLSGPDLVCLLELISGRPLLPRTTVMDQTGKPILYGDQGPMNVGQGSINPLPDHMLLSSMQHNSPMKSNAYLSSSPTRLESIERQGIDKSRQSSQSPSDSSRSQMGNSIINSKFMNTQSLNSNPQHQQGLGPTMGHQFVPPLYSTNQHQQQQHTSPQANRSSPFQPPMAVGPHTLARPPRSHSTIGGLGVGNFNSPYGLSTQPVRQPPAAHSNSSRPNIPGRSMDLTMGHPNLPSAPVTAHMSTITPRTPKPLLDSLPRTSIRGPLGPDSSNRDLMMLGQLEYQHSPYGRSDGLPNQTLMGLRQQDLANHEIAIKRSLTPHFLPSNMPGGNHNIDLAQNQGFVHNKLNLPINQNLLNSQSNNPLGSMGGQVFRPPGQGMMFNPSMPPPTIDSQRPLMGEHVNRGINPQSGHQFPPYNAILNNAYMKNQQAANMPPNTNHGLVPAHGIVMNQPGPMRLPLGEPMHVDIQQQRQSQSQTNSPKTNQRSIITGSASASGRKSKKAKPSPTPVTQTNEIKPTSELVASQSVQKTPNTDVNLPTAISNPTKPEADAPLSFAMQSDQPPAHGASVQKTDLGSFAADCTRSHTDAREAAASGASQSLVAVSPRGADALQKSCESKTNISEPASLAATENSLIAPQEFNEFKRNPSHAAKLDDSAGNINQPNDTTQTKIHANSNSEQPSKYQKLFSKKAWLKNYELEDQARITEEAAITGEKMAVRTRNKAESEEESASNVIKTLEDNPSSAEAKTNGGTKKGTSTKTENKKRIKDSKAKKSNSTAVIKSARVSVKGADNDSEGTNASTSDLDDTDETDSMKSSSNKKLRRMPRRKVKSNPDRESTDQPGSVAKSKTPKEGREKDVVSRKRGKKEKMNSASSDASSPAKRKYNSDDETVKQKTKKVKEEPEKESSPNLKTKKRAGEKFLQTEPCYEIVPKSIRCLECRRVRQSSLKGDKVAQSKQASKTNWDDFCRFFEFRKLRYNKSAQIVVAGFSDASDAKTSDLRIWLPLESAEVPENITLKVAKFILSNIGDKFCELVQQERSVSIAYEIRSGEKRTTWKRAVNGLRELCDVCSTTLFNNHFVCDRCGFVVCIDCHETRSKDTKQIGEEEDTKGDSSEIKNNNENSQTDTNDQVSVVSKKSKKDRHGWIFCAKNEEHSDDKLSLATIIAGDCLEEVWSMLHDMRQRLNLGDCICRSQANSSSQQTDDHKMNLTEEAPPESSEAQEASHSTLKGLLLASTNSSISDLLDTKAQNSIENGVTIKLEPSSSERKKGLLKDDNKVFDFGNEDDSQDDSRQVSAAIEGCIASLAVEGGDDSNRSVQETSTSISSRLCDGDLLVLHHPRNRGNTQIFRQHWRLGKPVLVRGVHKKMNIDMWLPQFFLGKFGDYRSDLVDCRNGDTHRKSMRNYWDGFEPTSSKKRVKDEAQPGHVPTPNSEEANASQYSGSALWRLKDWPPGQDFKEILPEHYEDFMNNLPLKSYTTRTGRLNLACRLPKEMLKPDLGPKMYSAYGTTKFPERGTTNLHLDISDAINVMVYVGGAMPFSQGLSEYSEMYDGTINDCYVDLSMKEQIRNQKLIPGALWHIFRPSDASKIRDFLNKVSDERNASDKRIDPIHDQTWYMDQSLLDRLQREYGVKSYAVLQCMGDALLIPAGAPHQVKNLQNCIKVANDFVSPENIEYCLQLTDEFRKLPETHINQEDKLQIKNIVYHSVKESIQYIKMFESGRVSLSDESSDEDDFDEEEAPSDLKTNMPPAKTE